MPRLYSPHHGLVWDKGSLAVKLIFICCLCQSPDRLILRLLIFPAPKLNTFSQLLYAKRFYPGGFFYIYNNFTVLSISAVLFSRNRSRNHMRHQLTSHSLFHETIRVTDSPDDMINTPDQLLTIFSSPPPLVAPRLTSPSGCICLCNVSSLCSKK